MSGVMGQSRRVGRAVLCTPRLTQRVFSARRGLPALPVPATTEALLTGAEKQLSLSPRAALGTCAAQRIISLSVVNAYEGLTEPHYSRWADNLRLFDGPGCAFGAGD
jgi:hypothetical protein